MGVAGHDDHSARPRSSAAVAAARSSARLPAARQRRAREHLRRHRNQDADAARAAMRTHLANSRERRRRASADSRRHRLTATGAPCQAPGELYDNDHDSIGPLADAAVIAVVADLRAPSAQEHRSSMTAPVHAQHHPLRGDSRRRPRQHAAEPERRARPVLHPQPADPDRHRRPHRRRRGARRREDPPDARGRARRSSSASRIGDVQRRAAARCSSRFADRDAGGRGLQTFDLRITIHAVTARRSRRCSTCSASTSACRSRRCSAKASSATAVEMLGYLFFVGDRTQDRPALSRSEPGADDDWFRLRHEEAMTPEAVVRLAEAAHARYGFNDFKLKGGVLRRRGRGRGRDRAARALPGGAHHARPERRLAARRTRSA